MRWRGAAAGRRRGRGGALAVLLLLASCDRANMARQGRDQTWDRNGFLPHDQVVQAPPDGAVAHGRPGADAPQPGVIDAALLARGQMAFDINCTPCHGASGDGLGMIVQRGFPRPPALFSAALRQATAAHFYDVISHGHGVMYSYADRVAPADRWAVVAWIRALQASAGTAAARLEPQDVAALDRAEGR